MNLYYHKSHVNILSEKRNIEIITAEWKQDGKQRRNVHGSDAADQYYARISRRR